MCKPLSEAYTKILSHKNAFQCPSHYQHLHLTMYKANIFSVSREQSTHDHLKEEHLCIYSGSHSKGVNIPFFPGNQLLFSLIELKTGWRKGERRKAHLNRWSASNNNTCHLVWLSCLTDKYPKHLGEGTQKPDSSVIIYIIYVICGLND